MRIRRRLGQSGVEGRARRSVLSWSWLVPRSWAILLAVALGIVGWLWYRYEGYQIVYPWLRRLAPKGGEQVGEFTTLQLDVGMAEYRALLAQREQAMRRGLLTEGETLWQPAQAVFQGASIPVQVRLTGSTPDHWQDHKWSLHVRIRGDTPLLDMWSFVLQSPATCGYLNGWLVAEDMRRAGLLAPRYSFVNVSVNGEGWGIYAAREDLSAESLASQGRRPGPVLRLNEGWPQADPIIAQFDVPVWFEVEQTLDSAHAAEAISLLDAFQNGRADAQQTFDGALLAKYMAHADLWGVRQENPWYDAYVYYNPQTGRLEPIGAGVPLFDDRSLSLVGLVWADDLAAAETYAQEMLRISQPEYLSEFRSAFDQTFGRYASALAQEFFPAYLEAPWKALSDRQSMLARVLRPSRPVLAKRVDDAGRPVVEVQVANLLQYPVILERCRAGGRTIDLRSEWVLEDDGLLLYQQPASAIVLRPARGRLPGWVTLRIPRAAFGDEVPTAGDPFYLVTRLVGLSEPVVVDIEHIVSLTPSLSDLPLPPSLEDALALHPFLALSEQPGVLDLHPGTWSVEGNLVLPEGMGLRASRPVTLTFDRGAWLVARGPLLLQGSDEGPVRLLPKDVNWGGIVVSGARSEGTSSLRDVEIRQTTGGVVFDESPVVLSRCHVLGSVARYAVRVLGSGFEFAHTEFGYAAFDAFGGDAATGQVWQCAFHDVMGDGISLRESQVTIQDTNLLRIYGRAVFADQGTQVFARGIRAMDVGVAVASVDRSVVLLNDVRVSQAWGAGLVAYVQDLGSSATLEVAQILFEDDSVETLTGDGGRVIVDGIPASAGQLDLEWLSVRRAAATEMQVVDYAFGSAVRLIGYDLLTPRLAPGQDLRLVLYWQALAKLNRDYTVFVHVLDEDGLAVAQWDAMPRDNTFPTTSWPVGEAIDDPRRVPLPADLLRKTYRIAVGLYYVHTGERLPATGPSGEPVLDAMVVLDQIEVR